MFYYLSFVIFSISVTVSAGEPLEKPIGQDSMVRFLTCKPKGDNHRFVELNIFASYIAFIPPGDIFNNPDTPAFVQVVGDADSEYSVHMGIPGKIKKYSMDKGNKFIQIEFIDRVFLGTDELNVKFSENESPVSELLFYDKSVTHLDCRLLPLPH